MQFKHFMGVLVAALLAWGSYLAIGDYLHYKHAGVPTHNWLRGVVILACVLGYLAFWGAMLAARKRRLRKQKGPRRLGPRDAC